MEVILKEKEAEDYYKEQYGIDITLLEEIVRQSLENLYFRGIRLSPKKLYRKLAACGVRLRPGTMGRLRMESLKEKIPAEPPMLTDHGAMVWYMTQENTFSEEDFGFLADHFPEETAQRYPSLWKKHTSAI